MALVVGFDGSPPSRRALEHAARHASLSGDALLLVTVIPEAVRRSSLATMMPVGIELPRAMSGTFEETARKRLAEVVAELARQGVKAVGEVRTGEAARTVLAVAAEARATHLFIGHKSYEDGQVLGPTAHAILAAAPVPVTVVP